MSEGTPRTVMVEANHLQGSQRRRSPRFGSPGALRESETKMALGVKRSITVRKIAPRKTAALSGNKENSPRRSQNLKETRGSTTEPGSNRRTPTSAGKKRQQALEPTPSGPSCSAGRRKRPQSSVPSPILASSPPAASQPAEPRDSVWTQKVRRSYSKLSDSSLHSPGHRDTLFGFEKLSTPEVVRSRVELSRSSLEVSGSFGSLLEADECGAEPDPNIPGVAVVKEKRKKRKVQQINTEELEVLAAQMNAEFREAEQFELVVE
ncbi:sororin [Poeciliopsis prolifica]|uniref:sororin n=1 Tax=Poeciliopsis prolifica TaxID=188132 RepID=UPI0024138473|nr:sororin [Poeciliopsis prolifica]